MSLGIHATCVLDNVWILWREVKSCKAQNLKKFPSHLLATIREKWSPNAKMQSSDGPRTYNQIRALCNWHCCSASGRLWLCDGGKYSILNDLNMKTHKRRNSERLLHDNLTLGTKQKNNKNISGLL